MCSGKRADLNIGSECGFNEASKEAPTGPEPTVVSTGPELSCVSSAISLGIELLSAGTIPRPREAAEEAVDTSRPLKRSPMGKTPITL